MRKLLSIGLIGLLVFFAAGVQTPALSSGQDEARALEKIKAKITKLGVGEKARAQIKLRNGQKIKPDYDLVAQFVSPSSKPN